MKILMIRLKPSTETIGLQHVMIVEPLELEILCTLVKKKHQPIIIDFIIEKKSLTYFLNKENPHITCITGYITNVNDILNTCKAIKSFNHKIVTIVGGVHCELNPEHFSSDFIDYRVVRNAVTVFSSLIEHISGHEILPKGILEKKAPMIKHQLPEIDFKTIIPDRSFTKKYRKHYFYIFHQKVALIKTSFGCPYECSFCYCRKITDGKYKELPLEHVVKELKSVNEKEIYIVDDDFLISKERIKKFIRLCKKKRIEKKYLIYGRADFIANNPELIKEFKSIGLKTVIVGFESFFNEELKSYNKNVNVKMNFTALKILQENHIDCFATIIIPPHWSKEDFKRCGQILKKTGLKYVNLQPFTPLPGTGILIDKKNIIIDQRDFEKWDLAHVSIKPEKLSVYEFYKQIVKLYNQILFQPKHLFGYLLSYSPMMLFKMLKGSFIVWKQYREKITHAKIKTINQDSSNA